MDQQHREDVPRISVDTLHDWERIKTSYATAAMAELEERMEQEGRKEEDKEALRAHMRKFIERTFEMSKVNLRVNGRNFEDLNEEEQEGIEPFDEGLDRHIWSLHDQSFRWDGEIGRKRREKPRDVERLMKELIASQQEADELEAQEFAQIDSAIEIEEQDDDAVPDEVEEVARQTFAIADELQQSVQLQRERSERLQVVSSEIKALK